MRRAIVLTALLLGGCTEPPLGGADALDRFAFLLCPSLAEKMVIEIDVAEGQILSQLALDGLLETVRTTTGRATIDVRQSRIPAQGGGYSHQDAFELHLEHSSYEPGPDAYLHILVLDGPSRGDDFQGNFVRDDAGRPFITLLPYYWNSITPLVTARELPMRTAFADGIERRVLVHEYGHAIGLVNRGLTPQSEHEHPDSPGHSSNPESVMYPSDEASGTNDATDTLTPVWQFDEADMEDIRAFQDQRCK